LQGIVVANIYRDDDKPDYRKSCLSVLVAFVAWRKYWGLVC
jgi:hypothetical protein